MDSRKENEFYESQSQEKLIVSRDWDILFILDACRYDFFEKSYKEFFDGKLIKTVSPASNTEEWCLNVVDKYPELFRNVVVISANPTINSMVNPPFLKFKPVGKFKKVYDVWTDEYANEIGTIHPKHVCSKLVELLDIGVRGRVMAWMIQPHAPYLNLDFKFEVPKPSTLAKPGFVNFVKKVGFKVEPHLPFWVARKMWIVADKLFGYGGVRKIIAHHGEQKLLEAYEYNLRTALREIWKIRKHLKDKKVVITSDHGEILTWKERKQAGGFGHPANNNHPILREVPWFEVEKFKRG